MESLRRGKSPRSERPFLYTIRNGELKVPYLMANGIFCFYSAKFHDTDLWSLKNFAQSSGGVVPYERWSREDFERAANPKESPGRKMIDCGSGHDGPVLVLYPLGFSP